MSEGCFVILDSFDDESAPIAASLPSIGGRLEPPKRQEQKFKTTFEFFSCVPGRARRSAWWRRPHDGQRCKGRVARGEETKGNVQGKATSTRRRKIAARAHNESAYWRSVVLGATARAKAGAAKAAPAARRVKPLCRRRPRDAARAAASPFRQDAARRPQPSRLFSCWRDWRPLRAKPLRAPPQGCTPCSHGQDSQ